MALLLSEPVVSAVYFSSLEHRGKKSLLGVAA